MAIGPHGPERFGPCSRQPAGIRIRRKEVCTMGNQIYPGVYEFYLGRIRAARNYGMRAGTEILDTVVSCCYQDDMLTADEVSSIVYLAGEQHKRIMEDNYNEGWK